MDIDLRRVNKAFKTWRETHRGWQGWTPDKAGCGSGAHPWQICKQGRCCYPHALDVCSQPSGIWCRRSYRLRWAVRRCSGQGRTWNRSHSSVSYLLGSDPNDVVVGWLFGGRGRGGLKLLKYKFLVNLLAASNMQLNKLDLINMVKVQLFF